MASQEPCARLSSAAQSSLHMEEIQVTEFYAFGMTLAEASRNLPAGISIVAVRRGHHNLVADDNIRLERDDVLLVAGNDVTGLRRLAEAAKTDPNARAGLQKAATEWILQRFLNTTESGVGGEKGLAGAGLIKTLNKSRSALEQVLDPEQMNSLQAVVADFERANRSVTAVRVKGSPNTAADLLRAQRAEGHHMPLWQKLFAIREVTEHLPEHILGLPLAKLAIPYAFGRQMLDVLHEAGHRKVADVVKQAILDPNVMRAAIKAADSRGAPVGFIKAVARHSMMGATAASQPARQALAQ